MSAISKNMIRDRMVNTAARIWDIDEHEIEQNIDPLALLLIEACAAEMEKIGYRIDESHGRLLDNLSELILPESLLGAIPASGILQASPIGESVVINQKTNFSLTEKIHRPTTNSYEVVDLHLSPVGNVRLVNASLLFMLAGKKLYSMQENKNKKLLHSENQNAVSNSFYLCISTAAEKMDLKGLSIYVTLRNHSKSIVFYNALEHARCYIDGKEIGIASGQAYFDQHSENIDSLIDSDGSKTRKLERKLSYVYSNRFLMLDENTDAAAAKLPAAVLENLPANVSAELNATSYIAIQVVLPQHFEEEVFDVMSCYINAFPAVNKELKSFSHKTDQFINIVSIPQAGTFFDLENIKNEKGESYKLKAGSESKTVDAGEVIVRSAGVGKSSSEDIRSMINNITETIRDQSAYFGQIGNESLLGRLREISKSLTGIEDAIGKSADKKPEIQYLLLRPKDKGEIIFVDYWITQTEDANVIKAFKPIEKVNNVKVNAKLCSTLTSFSGGRHISSEAEKKTILRQQIMSGAAVTSAEDIKILCKKVYGDKISKVVVSKGVQVGMSAQEGFQKSINVQLTLSDVVKADMQTEMNNLYQELSYYLQKNASPVYPFKIIIDESSKN